ncbi:hypothetical protein D3C73_999390 [compost metagenome]
MTVVDAFGGGGQGEVGQSGGGGGVEAKGRPEFENPGWRFSIALAFDRRVARIGAGQALAPGQAVFPEYHREGLAVFAKGVAIAFIALGDALDVVPGLAGDHDELPARIE